MIDPVRPLLVIAGAETLGALGLAVAVVLSLGSSDVGTLAAAATVGIWALIAAGLGLVWFGLYRRRRLARTPFLLAQAFALVVAWPLLAADAVVDVVLGAVTAVLAVAGLVLALRPSVRAALH